MNQLEDTLWAGLTDLHVKIPMGITAENLAEKYQITREDCDQYAYQTQQRWKAGEYVNLTLNIKTPDQYGHIFFLSLFFMQLMRLAITTLRLHPLM